MIVGKLYVERYFDPDQRHEVGTSSIWLCTLSLQGSSSVLGRVDLREPKASFHRRSEVTGVDGRRDSTTRHG